MTSLMKFANKIHAIKELRALFDKCLSPIVTKKEGNTVTLEFATVSLLDAKLFVEACMQLTKQEEPTCVWELIRKSALDGAISINPPERVGIFKSEEDATKCMNNVMRVRAFNDVWESSYDFMITKLPIRTGFEA